MSEVTVPPDSLPNPPWRRTVREEKPPKRHISQSVIIGAALLVIREEGLEALSIRRIAQDLHIGAATIYAHFANKDELLEFALDEVLGTVKVPDADPAQWAAQLAQVARAAYDQLIDYGDLARASLGRTATGPNALRLAEGMLGIMVAGGVPIQLAAWAKDRLFLYVHADAYEASQFLAKQRQYGPEGVRGYLQQVRSYYASLPAAEFPQISAHAGALVGGSCEERFEVGLWLLLDGLAARVAVSGDER